MPPIVLPQAESASTVSQAAAIVVTVFVIFTFLLPSSGLLTGAGRGLALIGIFKVGCNQERVGMFACGFSQGVQAWKVVAFDFTGLPFDLSLRLDPVIFLTTLRSSFSLPNGMRSSPHFVFVNGATPSSIFINTVRSSVILLSCHVITSNTDF